ncbi:MAG: isopropylmalate isomerase [Pontixanthobacter sp.]
MTSKLPKSIAGATAMGAAAIGSAAVAAALLYVNRRKDKPDPPKHETPSGEPPQTD